MTRVDLVWFNAGGGHRAAALALEQVITSQGRPWQVRRVNLSEVLDPTGLFRRVTGMEPEDLYNRRLASGFTLGLAQELKLLQGLIRLGHADAWFAQPGSSTGCAHATRSWWCRWCPISTAALFESLAQRT